MDKQKITRQLHSLAQEEIPETMDLWPRIQGQLKRKSKPRSFSFGLAHALSVFVMLILVGVGGYAAYQTTVPQPAITADDVTAFGMIQTNGGITASLDWAYADAHMITIQYSIIYNPNEIVLPERISVDLQSKSGVYFHPLMGGYGGSGGGSGDENEVRLTNQVSFDSSMISTSPDSLDLLLTIYYSDAFPNFGQGFEAIAVNPVSIMTATPILFGETVQPTALPPFEFTATPMPFDGNGSRDLSSTALPPSSTPADFPPILATPSPIGEFLPTVPPPDGTMIEPSLIPPMQFTPTPVPAVPSYGFTFSFSVPFYPAKIGQAENPSVEINGLVMEIQNLDITPMMSNFELCYSLPDLEGEWYPRVGVSTGFMPSPLTQGAVPSSTLKGDMSYLASAPMGMPQLQTGLEGRYCTALTSYAPFSPDGGEMQIIVDYLYRYADGTDPATWAEDERFFREHGFDLSYAYEAFESPEDENNFFMQSRPSNVLVYPMPHIGAVLVTIRDYPNHFQEWEAYNYIFDNMLKGRYEGPWVFNVTVD